MSFPNVVYPRNWMTALLIVALLQSDNRLGSCRYSPDIVKQGIECVSCLACAKCLLYHCHYEDENFTGIFIQSTMSPSRQGSFARIC